MIQKSLGAGVDVVAMKQRSINGFHYPMPFVENTFLKVSSLNFLSFFKTMLPLLTSQISNSL